MKSKKHFLMKFLVWLIAVVIMAKAGLYIEDKLSLQENEILVSISNLPQVVWDGLQKAGQMVTEVVESTIDTISEHLPGFGNLSDQASGSADSADSNPDGSDSGTWNSGDESAGADYGNETGSGNGEENLYADNDGSAGVSYYYYNQLPENEQAYYQTILNGLQNMDSHIMINTADQDEIWNLYQDVMDDHPELYYVDYSYTGSTFLNYAVLSPAYNCTKEEKAQKDIEIEAAEVAAFDFISGQESDYMTIKRTFQYVIDTVDYVEGAEDNQNLYSALVNGESVCAGYSREVQYLLQKMGIETLLVTGTVSETGAHAWNIVKCNGNYYQIDATFGDRAFASGYTEDMPELLHYDYTYLCCDDSVMYRDRTVDDNLSVPECSATDLNYYLLQGIYFDSYDSYVQNSVIANIQSGCRWWRGKFSNVEAYEEMAYDVNNSWYAQQIRYYGANYDSKIMTWSVFDDDNLVIYLWY